MHQEDPDFVNLRRGIVMSLSTSYVSKKHRIIKKNVVNAVNVQKLLKLASQKRPNKNRKTETKKAQEKNRCA